MNMSRCIILPSPFLLSFFLSLLSASNAARTCAPSVGFVPPPSSYQSCYWAGFRVLLWSLLATQQRCRACRSKANGTRSMAGMVGTAAKLCADVKVLEALRRRQHQPRGCCFKDDALNARFLRLCRVPTLHNFTSKQQDDANL